MRLSNTDLVKINEAYDSSGVASFSDGTKVRSKVDLPVMNWRDRPIAAGTVGVVNSMKGYFKPRGNQVFVCFGSPGGSQAAGFVDVKDLQVVD